MRVTVSEDAFDYSDRERIINGKKTREEEARGLHIIRKPAF